MAKKSYLSFWATGKSFTFLRSPLIVIQWASNQPFFDVRPCFLKTCKTFYILRIGLFYHKIIYEVSEHFLFILPYCWIKIFITIADIIFSYIKTHIFFVHFAPWVMIHRERERDGLGLKHFLNWTETFRIPPSSWDPRHGLTPIIIPTYFTFRQMGKNSK